MEDEAKVEFQNISQFDVSCYLSLTCPMFFALSKALIRAELFLKSSVILYMSFNYDVQILSVLSFVIERSDLGAQLPSPRGSKGPAP